VSGPSERFGNLERSAGVRAVMTGDGMARVAKSGRRPALDALDVLKSIAHGDAGLVEACPDSGETG
jgi:hypothetical protein